MIRPRTSRTSAPARALAAWLDPLTARVREPEIAWLAARPGFTVEVPDRAAATLVAAVRACLDARADVDRRADGLQAFAEGAEGSALRQVLERHVRATVATPWKRWGDLRALDRDLDLDALLEREAHEIEVQGARIEVGVRALSSVAASSLDRVGFERSGALALLCDVARRERRLPTRRAAVRGLAHAVAALAERGVHVDVRGLQALSAIVRDPEEDPWCRRAALDVVTGLEPAIARRWLEHALDALTGREPWLLRAKAAELLLAIDPPDALVVAERLAADPAELVRFEVCDGLGRRLRDGDAAAGRLLARLAAEGPPRTRARAVAAGGLDALATVGPRLLDVPLVATFALDVANEAARRRLPFPDEVERALRELAATGDPGPARRAALALHTADAMASDLAVVAARLGALRSGERSIVRLDPFVDVEDLARALVPYAADDHGFWLAPWGRTVRVTRGDVLRPRLWRILHELRHPAPTKRQTVSHALGRADAGRIRVPPAKLAEESATGVPGERVRVGREDGWGPGLPLVDDYLHALSGRPVTVVAPEGTVTVDPPRSFIRRLAARARMTLRYAEYDALRTACLGETDRRLRSRYVDAFRALGFATRTTLAEGGPWGGYFAASIVDPVAYALSLRSNTLGHLSLLVLLLGLVLLSRVTAVRSALARAREATPLVLGGWGTRGKSGTERLKAGMLEGLGVPLLSKTTGCEAMVLHAPPGGHAVELFLFRPYDRATIWEQVDVVRIGHGLGARAVLWECMALNPIYVDLLQTRWMKDDLSTLTNAYPDHEDVMGPTGSDVARVIGIFSPRGATVLTTEDNMRAELEEVARGRGSELVQVPRVDRELVATELLDRMPHVEHPANVALAASVGRALGVPWVEAIGLMGEHVLPDLGALSITPPAHHLGREVVFANGMSANDTLSFRHNWKRVGNLDHDHVADPSTWLVTVINNRADRVARSRVFAQVCAEEAAAHRHVLIGTNTSGFMGYFREAVERKLAATVLGTPEKVDALFSHLRVVDPGPLGDACAARLGAPEDPRRAWTAAVAALPPGPPTWSGARAHAERVRDAAAALERACTDGGGLAEALVEAAARHAAVGAARTATEAEARALYAELAVAGFVVLSDPGSTGDATIAAALGCCPPGARVRIMGVQNIKGTGLDFAYQWVYWRELAKGLTELTSSDPDRQLRGLLAVEANPFGSGLACDEALRVLGPLTGDAAIGARVKRQVARIEAKRAELVAARGRASAKAGWGSRLVRLAERALDPLDAVWRRRRARLVFRDLVDGRISHPRAQAWLQELTKRQKGGWLGRGRRLH